MEEKNRFFHYQSLKIYIHPTVYQPSEDTFLLLDSIQIKPNQRILEIGGGTGIISLSCSMQGAHVICTDINPYAIQVMKRNVKDNIKKLQGTVELRFGDLFDVINRGEAYNVIIFNPPYLPTKKEDYLGGEGWFDRAVSGGPSGLEVIRRFLNELSPHLYYNGCAYIILSSNSPVEEFKKILHENSLKSKIVNSLSFTDETIEVHRIVKKENLSGDNP